MRWGLFSNPAIILLIVPAEIAAPFCCCMQRRSGDRHDARKNTAGRKVFRRIADPRPRPYTPVAPIQERAHPHRGSSARRHALADKLIYRVLVLGKM
jgi:hypothetical protein